MDEADLEGGSQPVQSAKIEDELEAGTPSKTDKRKNRVPDDA